MKTLLALLALTLTGCGTIETVFRSDAAASQTLKKENSYCGAVPRIYSGVSYDLCRVFAPYQENRPDKTGESATRGMLIDIAASGVLDTLLLPYTIYQQQTDGSLIVAD